MLDRLRILAMALMLGAMIYAQIKHQRQWDRALEQLQVMRMDLARIEVAIKVTGAIL